MPPKEKAKARAVREKVEQLTAEEATVDAATFETELASTIEQMTNARNDVTHASQRELIADILRQHFRLRQRIKELQQKADRLERSNPIDEKSAPSIDYDQLQKLEDRAAIMTSDSNIPADFRKNVAEMIDAIKRAALNETHLSQIVAKLKKNAPTRDDTIKTLKAKLKTAEEEYTAEIKKQNETISRLRAQRDNYQSRLLKLSAEVEKPRFGPDDSRQSAVEQNGDDQGGEYSIDDEEEETAVPPRRYFDASTPRDRSTDSNAQTFAPNSTPTPTTAQNALYETTPGPMPKPKPSTRKPTRRSQSSARADSTQLSAVQALELQELREAVAQLQKEKAQPGSPKQPIEELATVFKTILTDLKSDGKKPKVHQRLGHVPSFSGKKSELEKWVAHFENATSDLDEEEKLVALVQALQGKALDYVRSQPVISKNYALAMRYLKETFSPQRNDAVILSEWQECRQGRKQALDEFIAVVFLPNLNRRAETLSQMPSDKEKKYELSIRLKTDLKHEAQKSLARELTDPACSFHEYCRQLAMLENCLWQQNKERVEDKRKEEFERANKKKRPFDKKKEKKPKKERGVKQGSGTAKSLCTYCKKGYHAESECRSKLADEGGQPSDRKKGRGGKGRGAKPANKKYNPNSYKQPFQSNGQQDKQQPDQMKQNQQHNNGGNRGRGRGRGGRGRGGRGGNRGGYGQVNVQLANEPNQQQQANQFEGAMLNADVLRQFNLYSVDVDADDSPHVNMMSPGEFPHPDIYDDPTAEIDYEIYTRHITPADARVHEELQQSIGLQQVLTGANEPQLAPYTEGFWRAADDAEVGNLRARAEGGFSFELAKYSQKHPEAVFADLRLAQCQEAKRCAKFARAHFLVKSLAHSAVSANLPRVPMRMGTLVDMSVLLDTGSQYNTISTFTLFNAITRCREWSNAFRTALVTSNTFIGGIGDSKYIVLGKILLRVDFNDKSAIIAFAVHEGKRDSIILGLKGLEKLGFKLTNSSLDTEVDFIKLAQKPDRDLNNKIVRAEAKTYSHSSTPLLFDRIVRQEEPMQDQAYCIEQAPEGAVPILGSRLMPLSMDDRYRHHLMQSRQWCDWVRENTAEARLNKPPSPDMLEATHWSRQKDAEDTIKDESDLAEGLGFSHREFANVEVASLWWTDEV